MRSEKLWNCSWNKLEIGYNFYENDQALELGMADQKLYEMWNITIYNYLENILNFSFFQIVILEGVGMHCFSECQSIYLKKLMIFLYILWALTDSSMSLKGCACYY